MVVPLVMFSHSLNPAQPILALLTVFWTFGQHTVCVQLLAEVLLNSAPAMFWLQWPILAYLVAQLFRLNLATQPCAPLIAIWVRLVIGLHALQHVDLAPKHAHVKL